MTATDPTTPTTQPTPTQPTSQDAPGQAQLYNPIQAATQAPSGPPDSSQGLVGQASMVPQAVPQAAQPAPAPTLTPASASAAYPVPASAASPPPPYLQVIPSDGVEVIPPGAYDPARAAQAGVSPEQAQAIEQINERFTKALAPIRSLEALALETVTEDIELHRARVEVFPDRPGAFTLWVLPSAAKDFMTLGKAQAAMRNGNPGEGRTSLLDYVENCVYSWNSSDPLNRAALEDMKGTLLLAMWYAILGQVVNTSEKKQSASI